MGRKNTLIDHRSIVILIFFNKFTTIGLIN